MAEVRRRAGLARGPRARRGGPGWHGPLGLGPWQTAAAAVGALVLLGLVGIIAIAVTLPDPERVNLHTGEIKLFDRTGTKLIADVTGDQIRHPVPINQISPLLQHATVAAEDRHFYENRLLGIDAGRLLKAMTIDLVKHSAVQGASTITQQLARIELLSPGGSPDRSFARKVKEAILSTEIEQRFTKDKILELYLNAIYYGHQAYGAQAAAQVYYGKDAKDLNLAQASFLAGLPQAPSYYDPQTNCEGARGRQSYVLDQMVRDGYATRAEADAAAADVSVCSKTFKVQAAQGPAPHFVHYVVGVLQQQYGSTEVQAGGLSVVTTLDLNAQNAAVAAIQAGLPKLKYGKANNSALLAEKPSTGEILAYVGSADFNSVDIAGQVDIVQAKRQPGSSFKPYEYVTGIMNHKFDTLTSFDDSPSAVPPISPGHPVRDFDNSYQGKMRLRTALVESRNVPAEQAMQVAGVDSVIEVAHRFGIASTIQPYLSSALGSSEVTMLEHTEAYGVFATEGSKHEPVAILKVVDSSGHDITIQPQAAQKVADAAPLHIINDVLSNYDKQWHLGLDRKMSVKSGTSNVGDCCTGDAWLMLYNQDLVVAGWTGRTSNDPNQTAATNGLFGVDQGKAIAIPFIKAAFPGSEWKHWFDNVPSGIKHVKCSDQGLNVPDQYAPADGELVLQDDNPSCNAPSPSPSPTDTPSPSPTDNSSPNPTPTGIVLFPTPTPTPHPTASPPPSSPSPGPSNSP